MKKSKLIEYLQSIKGDPDILLWNGVVEDAVPLDKDIQIDYQVKHSPEYFINELKYNWYQNNCRDYSIQMPTDVVERLNEKAKEYSKNSKWDFPNHFFDEEAQKRNYNRKRKVLILQPKIMNKTYSDRIGNITY